VDPVTGALLMEEQYEEPGLLKPGLRGAGAALLGALAVRSTGAFSDRHAVMAGALMTATFRPMDAAFYAFAAYESFKLVTRRGWFARRVR
jgi:hypothetical protein